MSKRMRLRLTHTTRLLITLLALVVAWIGAVGLASAASVVSSQSAAGQMAYTYDNLGTSTEFNTVAERGPPGIAYDYTALRLAVDTASHGISASPRPASTLTYNDYGHPAQLAEVAAGSGTTRTASGARAADASAVPGASAAANGVDDVARLTASQQRSLRSLQGQVEKHQTKLDAYRANPDAYDNLGILERAPTPEIRQRIIDGRIRHLETEIRTFQDQIDKLLGGG